MTRQLLTAGFGLLVSLLAAATSADVVVVVSERSAIRSLTRAELADIYLGRLTRLETGERLIPIDQIEASPTHDTFYQKYLERSPAQIKAHWSKLIFTGRGQPPRAVDNGEKVLEIAASNSDIIGYVDSEQVDDRVRIVSIE